MKSLNATYLLLFVKQLEHALHVDEGILDHSAVAGEGNRRHYHRRSGGARGEERSDRLLSPVVGSEPVEWRVQLDDVGAEQDKIPDLGVRAASAGAQNKFQNDRKKSRGSTT